MAKLALDGPRVVVFAPGRTARLQGKCNERVSLTL
jgi:hypothetical protein